MLTRKGLIAITGTTGVGKSQLAIEIARAINGEVINADALQVYKGYDIITNKATEQETMGVPHHILGVVDSKQEYTVQQFEHDALAKISEIHSRNRMPILVGGTNYYIQSVMFRSSLISAKSRHSPASTDKPPSVISRKLGEGVSGLTNEELWEELNDVDPIMASKWHPNNRRKVLRSLEVYRTTGKRHSDWIRESEAARSQEETLRFPTLLFWLYAESTVLNKRLDDRVDTMIARGIFDELAALKGSLAAGELTDFTRGLKQAIGFSEFEGYLSALGSEDVAPEELEALKSKGVEDMKTSTRQYAKRQISWIRNKLLPECNATHAKATTAHSYLLDATDLETWDRSVKSQALSIVDRFLHGSEMPDPQSISSQASVALAGVKQRPNSPLAWKKYRCNVCSKTAEESLDGVARDVWLNGEDEYNQHVRSRRHRKNKQHRKRFNNSECELDPKRSKTHKGDYMVVPNGGTHKKMQAPHDPSGPKYSSF